MTSSQFNPGSTSVRPQKLWTSPFYGSMNGPDLKTLVLSNNYIVAPFLTNVFKTVYEKWLKIDNKKTASERSIWEINKDFVNLITVNEKSIKILSI